MLPRNGFLGLAVILNCAHVAHATGADEILPASARSDSRSVGVLVLKESGRVIKGDIRPRPTGGYDVHTPLSQLFIPQENIWVQGNDVDDAYQKMRESMPRLTPDIHMQLAHWCVSQKMFGTARRELLDALHLDPYRADVRHMLATVTDYQSMGDKQRKGQSSATDRLEAAFAGSIPPRRIMGDLTRDQARLFSRNVQPLLSRHCTSCHHQDSGRDFTLMSSRNAPTTTAIEYNLSQLLRQIDFDSVQKSPILTVGGSVHGGMTKATLEGRTEALQWDAFRQWIESVTSTKAGPNGGEERDGSHKSNTGASTAENSEIKANPTSDRALKDEEFLQDAARRNRSDAFNPDDFNRQYLTVDPTVTEAFRTP